MPISIGDLVGKIVIQDTSDSVVDKFTKRLSVVEKEINGPLDKAVKQFERQLYQTITALDPATARLAKYEHAQKNLTHALKLGIITQDQYNKHIDQAKDKYLAVVPAARDAERAVERLSRKGQSLSAIGGSLTAGITVPLALISGLSVKAAKDFESSFAGVDKTVDGLTDAFGNLTREGAALQKGLKDLASGKNPIPIDVNELNRIAESAGQLGIARDDILSFTRVMADLGVTTNLTSTEAADAIARFQNIFGAAGKEVDRFGSVLVALGNKSASTEKDILSMGVRIAAAGNQIKLTQGEVLAIAAALSSVGIEAEAGGSAISKVMIDMGVAVATNSRQLTNFAKVAGQSASDFAKAFREDAAGAILTFVEGLNNIKGEQALRVLDEMGIKEVRMRNALLSAAGAGNLLRDSIRLQAQAWKDNSALTDEAEKRYKTFDSQLKIFVNELRDAAITLGTALIPMLRDMLQAVRPVLDIVKSLAEWFSELDHTSKIIIGTFAGVAASVGPVLVVSGKLITAWTSLVGFSPKIAALAGPWGLVTLGIVAATTATIALIDQWKKASEKAIELDVRLGNLEGSARRFQITMQKAQGVLTKTQVMEAREVARQLAIELNEAQERLDEAIKKLPAEQRKFAEGNKDKAGTIVRLREPAAEVERLTKAYEQQKKAIREIKEVIDDTATSTGNVTEEVKGQSGVIDIISAKEEKRQNELEKINRLMEEESLFLSEQRKLADRGIQDSITRHKEEQRINDAHEERLAILRYEEQFGRKIAEQLARQELIIKRMDRQVKLELKTSVELVKIDLSSDTKKRFEDSIRDLMVVLEDAGDQAKLDAEAFGEFNRAQDQWLEDFANSWMESLKTIEDVTKEDLAAIQAAFDEGYFGEGAEAIRIKERAEAQVRAERLDTYLSQWEAFFSFLGNRLGGVFQQISQAIQTIQSARQMGSQLGSMVSGIGAVAGAAAGAIIGVVIAIYDKMKGDLEKRKQQSYGYGAVLGRDAGMDWNIPLEDAARRATVQIRRTIEAFAEALGGVFTTFADLQVQIRRDGKYFRAFVEGEFIGSFQGMESAVEAAILAAFKRPETMLSGVSDLIREGLAKAIEQGLADFGSLDELEEFLGRLKEISDINLGDAVVEALSAARNFDRLWEAIARVGDATNAVVGGINNLVMAEARMWQEMFDSITGRQKTSKEIRAEKEAELKVAKAELEIRKATIAQRILQAKAEIAAYEAGNLFIGGIKTGGGGGGKGQNPSGGVIGIAYAMSKAAEVAGASIALLSDTTTNAVDKMVAALKAEVAGLEALLGALGNLQIPEIDLSGGRGGSGVDRGQIRDDLRDQIRQLEAQAKGPLHEALLSLQNGIEDFTERAKEGKLPPTELARAIELMTKQFQQSVMEQARGYAGLGTEFTKRIQDTKRFFDELEELGRKKSGIPNWLREVLEGKAFDRLGKELSGMIAEFTGLVDPMLAINLRADELRQNVLAFAQAAGWSGDQIREAMRQIEEGIQFQRQQGINSVLDRLFGYLKQAGLFQKEAQEFEKRKALIDLQLIEAQLRFYGALDATTQGWIDAARDFVDSMAFGNDSSSNDVVRVQIVNPEDIYGTMIEAVRSAVNEFRAGIEEFTNSTQDLLTDEQLSGLTQQEQLSAAKGRFDLLLSQAQGGSTDALKQLTEARREYLEELRQSEGAGFGFDVEWDRIMEGSAELLANARQTEEDIIADLLYHNETTIQAVMTALSTELQTTLYDVAEMISRAIYDAIGSVPSMAAGGVVMRGPRLVRVAEMGTPEAIVPLDRLMQAVPYQVQAPGMAQGQGTQDNGTDPTRSWYDLRARDSSARLDAIEVRNATMVREMRLMREEIRRRR